MRKLNKLLDILCNLALWISVSSFVITVFLNIINIFLRWLMNFSIDWVLELSLILFVYSVMFVIPIVYRDKNFVTMRLIDEMISGKALNSLSLFVDIIILFFFIYLLWFSIGLNVSQINMMSRGLGIARIYISLPISVGAGLCIMVSISNIVHKILKFYNT